MLFLATFLAAFLGERLAVFLPIFALGEALDLLHGLLRNLLFDCHVIGSSKIGAHRTNLHFPSGARKGNESKSIAIRQRRIVHFAVVSDRAGLSRPQRDASMNLAD